MKPKNFPGRKHRRRSGVKREHAAPEVTDIKVRLGKGKRDPITGRAV